MKKKTIFIACIAMLFSAPLFAQKIKVNSGNLDFLKGVDVINVEYDYESMGVGKYDRESDYVADKVSDYNAKEPGRGDTWKESWVADREERFEPKFEELINKSLEKKNVSVGGHPDAEYTLILKTTFTEPGFNVGVVRKNASINCEAVFVSTSSGEELATVTITNSPGRGGMGYDFDTGFRIQEAYAKAGKELGRFISKYF